MIEWSDDDEDPVAPPPSMQTPSRSTHMEEQSRGNKEILEQQTTEILAEQATDAPEQQTEINPERWVEENPEQ